MNINKRLFGTPLGGGVKKKLEERQNVAANPQPGETIQGVFTNKGNIVNELGSRTPFVRMWTSVKIIDPSVISETLEEFIYDEDATIAQQKKIKVKAEAYSQEHPNSQVIYSEQDKKYYVKSKDRDQFDYARKVYIVGDYSYQTNYGEVGIGEPIDTFGESSEITPMLEELLPQQLQSNKYMKPQAGITTVSSNTEGSFGLTKKTTVNFTVHNFTDFDKIYNKYFLKPGATIFVDFGWSSVKDLYKPEELIQNENIKEYLYANIDEEEMESTQESSEKTLGKVTENEGDLEVIQGIVTDYDAKILPNGSVECSVTLTSANSALLGFETNEDTTRTIQNILNYGVVYLAVGQTLEASEEITEETQKFYNRPNIDSSTQDLAEFNENLFALAQKNLSAQLLLPKGNAVRTGIFISSLNVDDVYISFGLFEDLIINSQFGFGKNQEDIISGTNQSVRIDSTNSFTKYHSIFEEKQKTMSYVSEPSPNFLIPEWWGNSDPKDLEGSYNHQKKKLPYSFYPKVVSHTPYDIENERIPIREIFINTDVIITAFQENNNVKKVINSILSFFNEESQDAFKWTMMGGETNSELTIVDMNFVEAQSQMIKSGLDEEGDNIAFKNLFTFNIMSKGSIVTNYDINFSMPSGNIGNMYAIQAMSHENKMFPLTHDIEEAIAINSLDSSKQNPTENLSIVYEPDIGGYRADQIGAKSNKNSNIIDTYQTAENLLSNDIYQINTTAGISVIAPDTDSDEEGGSEKVPKGGAKGVDSYEDIPAANRAELELKKSREVDDNNDRLSSLGYKVMGKFKDYYNLREKTEIVLKVPTLIPFKLNLTIYGIASIIPGDTFRVDYLPTIYLENVYLQTTKVTQNLNSSGWFTTLETQFRPRPEIKNTTYEKIDPSKNLLSPKAISQLKLQSFWDESRKYKLPNHTIYPYLSFIRIINLPTNLQYINLILEFTYNGPDISSFKPSGFNIIFPNICEVKVTKGATSTEVRTSAGEPQADDYYGLTTKYNVSNDKKKFTVAGYFTKNLVNAIDGTGDFNTAIEKNKLKISKYKDSVDLVSGQKYYWIINGDYWMMYKADDTNINYTDLDFDVSKRSITETFNVALKRKTGDFGAEQVTVIVD